MIGARESVKDETKATSPALIEEGVAGVKAFTWFALRRKRSVGLCLVVWRSGVHIH